MKDRNAFVENRVERGVDPDAVKHPRRFGVPAGSHPGLVPVESSFQGIRENEVRGNVLRSDYYVMPEKKLPPACQGINKKGLACGAHPIKGGEFCVGHKRSEQARNSE